MSVHLSLSSSLWSLSSFGSLPPRLLPKRNELLASSRDRWTLLATHFCSCEPTCLYAAEKDNALVPTLYRESLDKSENLLLQTFRIRAPGFSDRTPARDNTDEWLYLARHVGLPTRLLDWSEGALIGLCFALMAKTRAETREEPPVVWMLNPLQLNYFAEPSPAEQDPATVREFPLPWHRPDPPRVNIAHKNICGAWENDGPGVPLPVAVYPTYVHDRLRGQRACFTIQGKRKEGLNELVPPSILKRYEIDPGKRDAMRKDLVGLGVTESVVFPDLEGLAREIRARFS
jgi:FRG domain